MILKNITHSEISYSSRRPSPHGHNMKCPRKIAKVFVPKTNPANPITVWVKAQISVFANKIMPMFVAETKHLYLQQHWVNNNAQVTPHPMIYQGNTKDPKAVLNMALWECIGASRERISRMLTSLRQGARPLDPTDRICSPMVEPSVPAVDP